MVQVGVWGRGESVPVASAQSSGMAYFPGFVSTTLSIAQPAYDIAWLHVGLSIGTYGYVWLCRRAQVLCDALPESLEAPSTWVS